jgi:hypothetical protein
METVLQEKTIDMSIVKLNVTDTEIAKLKEQYLPLVINGIDDKEGLKRVYAARQEVKRLRVSLEKYADDLKEDALRWQKKVVAEKNRVVSEFKMIEAHLQSEEDKIAEEKERIRLEEERKEQERIQKRIDRLAEYGYAIDLTFLKTISDDDFEKVVDNAKSEHEKELAARAEQERLAKEEAEKLKAEREELDRLRKQQAEAQRIIDEQNRKLREEEERQSLEREAVRKQMLRNRCQQLTGLGMTFSPIYNAYVFKDVNVDVLTELNLFDDERWNELIEKITPVIADREKEIELQKQAEVDRIQKEAAEKALREKQEEEEKQKQLEAEKLAQSSDKVKWNTVIDQLQNISIPEMKSRKAKTLANVVTTGLNKIIDNITTTM